MIARRQRAGPERVLLAIYLVFLIAAGARSTVQLSTHPTRAPLAYGLSLVAALVYAAGFLLIRRLLDNHAVTALRVCSAIELTGVLTIGTWTIIDPAAFPDATVWSSYGAGYLFLPLALPIVVLTSLRPRHRC